MYDAKVKNDPEYLPKAPTISKSRHTSSSETDNELELVFLILEKA